MFNINSSDMNKIKKESLSNVLDRVELREKVEDRYKISIFSIEINSEQELEETWNDISHEIANSYQSKFLHNDIEIWNVYLIFFYSDFISDNLKYSIESNKFSSRKLVLKNDNSSIDDLIYNKLFSLNIKKNTLKNDVGNVEEIISKTNKKIIDILKFKKFETQLEKLLEEIK